MMNQTKSIWRWMAGLSCLMLASLLLSSCSKSEEFPRSAISFESDQFFITIHDEMGKDLLTEQKFANRLYLYYRHTSGYSASQKATTFFSQERNPGTKHSYVVLRAPKDGDGVEGDLVYAKEIFYVRSGDQSSSPAEIIYYWKATDPTKDATAKRALQKIIYNQKTYTKNAEGIIVVPIII